MYARNHRHEKGTDMSENPSEKDVTSNPFMGAAPARELDVPEPASARLTWAADGEKIDYAATAAHLDVVSDAGKLLGRMFSLSYVAVDEEGAADPARPVTFAFNGGPGSSSVPINFGGIGPRRVATDGCGHVRADAAVEDNPHTVLRDTDVVFLDALGTGWSCVADDCEPASVFGVDGDADAFARAICAWLEENGRWSSPLYLFGESYGTVRNSVLMRILGERGVAVTGVVLLSAILDWVQVQPGEDLYYLGMMPTYAATAQWFGRAGKGVDPDEWFDRALEFTEDVLAPALLKGDRLDARREREVARKMSKFVGLAPEYLQAHHLRVDLADFRMALLADEGKICGRLDTRFASDALSPMQTSVEWVAGEDAAADAVEPAWTKAFRAFCREELGYRGAARYLLSNYEKVGTKWDWRHEEPGCSYKAEAPNVAVDIAVALRRNPTCKLAIIGGRYDAATTFWNVVHDMSCQYLSPELKERVSWYRYGCGHMAYTDVPTLEAMGEDLHEWYQRR